MDFFGYLDHIRIRIVEKLTPGTGGDNGSEGSPGAASRDSEHGGGCLSSFTAPCLAGCISVWVSVFLSGCLHFCPGAERDVAPW